MAHKINILSEQNKDKPHVSQLSLLVDMNHPSEVMEEVKIIFLDMFSNGEFTPLFPIFESVVSLFSGNFPGFKGCDTPYHNLKHTTDVFLAVARLLHGAHIQGVALNELDVRVGLIAALMHDTGYIQKDSESIGSGAVLTSVHVQRSIDFMQQYLSTMGSSAEFISRCKKMILSTDLEYPFNRIGFSTHVDKTIAQMIAGSDLLAQTADRNYLEKLQLLFQEFKEAGDKRHTTVLDLIKDAPQFNDFIQHRLANELEGIDRYMRSHFKNRWGNDQNMYQEAINRVMVYLAHILESDAEKYKIHFRRALKTLG